MSYVNFQPGPSAHRDGSVGETRGARSATTTSPQGIFALLHFWSGWKFTSFTGLLWFVKVVNLVKFGL